jgi:hypothetical protein
MGITQLEGMGALLMPDLPSLLRPPYLWLIVGVISFSGAVVSTCTGKSWGRFGGVIYRAEEPKQFWWLVGIYYLGGVIFIIGYFLNKVHAP